MEEVEIINKVEDIIYSSSSNSSSSSSNLDHHKCKE